MPFILGVVLWNHVPTRMMEQQFVITPHLYKIEAMDVAVELVGIKT